MTLLLYYFTRHSLISRLCSLLSLAVLGSVLDKAYERVVVKHALVADGGSTVHLFDLSRRNQSIPTFHQFYKISINMLQCSPNYATCTECFSYSK